MPCAPISLAPQICNPSKQRKKIVWWFNLFVSKSIAVLKIYLFNTEIYIVIILLLFVTRPVKIQNLSRYKKNGVSLCIPNNDITIVQYYPTRRQYMGWDLNDANKHKPVWRALGISGFDPVPIAERRSSSSSTTSSSTAEAEVQAAPTSWPPWLFSLFFGDTRFRTRIVVCWTRRWSLRGRVEASSSLLIQRTVAVRLRWSLRGVGFNP